MEKGKDLRKEKALNAMRLRRATGCALMDCDKALKDSNNDFGKAERRLKEMKNPAIWVLKR